MTGLYFYDNRVVEMAGYLKPSRRCELDITVLSRLYMGAGDLLVEHMGCGYAWLTPAPTTACLRPASLFARFNTAKASRSRVTRKLRLSRA